MTLNIDTSKPLRRVSDIEALVAAVRDADANDEAHFLEWKSQLDLTSKHGGYTIGKAVLGFGNRDPLRAERNMGGCAYLVVGVEPLNVAGVTQVDHAKLEQLVDLYVGAHQGPVWSPQYVKLDGHDVLVVTVEAPAAGDRAFPLRKTYQDHKGDGADEGTIFVRHNAKTERATAADHDMLTTRSAASAARSSMPDDVAVGWVGDVPTVPKCDPTIGRDDWLRAERDALMESVRHPRPIVQPAGDPQLPMLVDMSSFLEPRSASVYEAEVDAYVRRCGDVWSWAMLSRYYELGVGELTLQLANPSEHNLPAVQLQVRFPDTVWVFPRGFEEVHLPRRPAPFGEKNMLSLGVDHELIAAIAAGPRNIVPASFLPKEPPYEVENDGQSVTFRSVDLRPQGAEKLRTVVVAVAPHHPDQTVTAAWSATSTAFNGVHKGTVTFEVDGLLTVADLFTTEETDDDE